MHLPELTIDHAVRFEQGIDRKCSHVALGGPERLSLGRSEGRAEQVMEGPWVNHALGLFGLTRRCVRST